MIKSLMPTLAILALLSACSGGDGTNPINNRGDEESDSGSNTGDTPIEPGDEVVAIPEDLALNVTGVTYNRGANDSSDADDTLVVELSSLDAAPKAATYLRNAALDTGGYKAFSVQDDPLDRIYVAVAKEHRTGNVMAAAAGDGGQFLKFYRGTHYERTGDYVHPTTGQVSYAGYYAGITNLDDLDQDQRKAIPAGTDPSLYPSQARQTSGKIFLNVNFGDNAVNGAIYEKAFTDGEALPDVYLNEGTMDNEGKFKGTAEFATPDGPKAAGKFGGIVGTNQAAVAGSVAMDTIFTPDDPRDNDFDKEVGIFVLPRCGTSGAPSVCDEVKDFK